MPRTYEEETALIADLEAKPCPPFTARSKENNWRPNNSDYYRYVAAIKDAYWRRRQLSAKPGECAPG